MDGGNRHGAEGAVSGNCFGKGLIPPAGEDDPRDFDPVSVATPDWRHETSFREPLVVLKASGRSFCVRSLLASALACRAGSRVSPEAQVTLYADTR